MKIYKLTDIITSKAENRIAEIENDIEEKTKELGRREMVITFKAKIAQMDGIFEVTNSLSMSINDRTKYEDKKDVFDPDQPDMFEEDEK